MTQTINPEGPRARQLDRANFNRALGLIQNLSRLTFDKNHFQVSWHGPIPVIRLRRGILAGGTSMPFDVSHASATTVNVAGGYCYIGGIRRTVSSSAGLDCSAGTSTTGYIYVALTLPSTAGSITYSATLPTSDGNTEYLILAHVSKNGSSNISGISQRWRGDFYLTRF